MTSITKLVGFAPSVTFTSTGRINGNLSGDRQVLAGTGPVDAAGRRRRGERCVVQLQEASRTIGDAGVGDRQRDDRCSSSRGYGDDAGVRRVLARCQADRARRVESDGPVGITRVVRTQRCRQHVCLAGRCGPADNWPRIAPAGEVGRVHVDVEVGRGGHDLRWRASPRSRRARNRSLTSAPRLGNGV